METVEMMKITTSFFSIILKGLIGYSYMKY